MDPEQQNPTITLLTEEDLIPSSDKSIETIGTITELFYTLSRDEQDEILRLIILDGGFNRILSAIQDVTTPGAFDIFLDKVQYFHFLRSVKDDFLK
jgi:hypothetical protein